ncbi:MAG: sulfite exporter TauE/SafE family protein [Calditrichaeota bacterium]|nr:MAG: sulfite exporter TauE/SafE family protein [Calditrichota bacterium]
MTELLKIAGLMGLGIVAGLINVMAGGGSTLTMPILIFMGLDAATANGTNRVAIFFQNLFAVFSFHREEFYHFSSVLHYAAWAIPGAIIGSLVAVRIDDQLFQKILAVVIIGVMISVMLPQRPAASRPLISHQWLIYPVLLFIGFYAGFIQAGVGFIFMAAFFHILKQNLVQVNKSKVFIIFFTSLPALIVFALSAKIHLTYALALSAGNAAGGWWAARLTIRKGEKLIRWVLFAAVLLMAIKLFGLI